MHPPRRKMEFPYAIIGDGENRQMRHLTEQQYLHIRGMCSDLIVAGYSHHFIRLKIEMYVRSEAQGICSCDYCKFLRSGMPRTSLAGIG